jgi:very-short-patch-repair endonuclease
MPPDWDKVRQTALRQHDMVSVPQLEDAACSRHAIAHAVDTKRLYRVRRGVLSLRPPPYTWVATAMGVVLAYGPKTVLGFRAAGRLWRLPVDHGPFEVICPTRRRHREGVIVHLGERVGTKRDGVPTTMILDTLDDLATVAGAREFEKCVAEALHLGLAREDQLRKGCPRLRALLETPPAFTRREGEERLLALVRAAGLPDPRTNVYVCGIECDAAWLEPKVVVEFNSYAFHATRPKFERDNERAAILGRNGYLLIPITWRMLTEQPELVVARLAGAIASRSPIG